MRLVLQAASAALLALVTMTLFLPTSYVEVKAALLVVGTVTTVLLGLQAQARWDRTTLAACAALAIFGLANSFHGVLQGNPGAFRVLSVMAAWPLLYAFFSALLNQPRALEMLAGVLKLALALVVLYSASFLGTMGGILPAWMYVELTQGQRVGFYEGVIEYTLFSISSLLFLLPFLLHDSWNRFVRGRMPSWQWVLMLGGVVLSVLTGRRAVQMVVLMVPGIALVSHALMHAGAPQPAGTHEQPGRSVRVAWAVGALGVLFAYALVKLDIRLDRVWTDFSAGFDFEGGSSASASERTGQFQVLIQHWLDGNLLIGAGNGATTDYVRSDIMPWAYELSYVYLLFSTGLLGVLFYLAWFVWGVLRLRSALSVRTDLRPLATPLLSGVFGLALGAASNPYFAKFDYLWIVLLPHLLAGCIRYQRLRT